MHLSEIHTVSHLIIELVRGGWRRSPNQNPLEEDPSAPYFRGVNIDQVVGNTFEHDYLRRVDIYPQGENLGTNVGLTALISPEDHISRWEVFQHYSGSRPVAIEQMTIELSVESIRAFLVKNKP